jgi:hypothetical protein
MTRSKNGLKLRLSWMSDSPLSRHLLPYDCVRRSTGDNAGRGTSERLAYFKNREEPYKRNRLNFVVTSRRDLTSATHAYYPVHANLNEFAVNVLGKKKSLVQTMKASMASRGIALLFL